MAPTKEPSKEEIKAACDQLEEETGLTFVQFRGSTGTEDEEGSDAEDDDEEDTEEPKKKRVKKEVPAKPAKSVRDMLLDTCYLFLPKGAEKLACEAVEAMWEIKGMSYGDTHINNLVLDNTIQPAARKGCTALRKKDYGKALGHGMAIVMCALGDEACFMADQELWCAEKEWKKLLKDTRFLLNGLLKATDADLGFDEGGLARNAMVARIKTAADEIDNGVCEIDGSDDVCTFKLTALK